MIGDTLALATRERPGSRPGSGTGLAELYLEGSSTVEAAERLGVPVGTVKSRAHYALRSLRIAITGTAR